MASLLCVILVTRYAYKWGWLQCVSLLIIGEKTFILPLQCSSINITHFYKLYDGSGHIVVVKNKLNKRPSHVTKISIFVDI